jgi:ADP-heptose:LPS heptosyltransferase
LINTDKVRFEFLKNKLFFFEILEEKISIEKPEIDVKDISTKFKMSEDYIVFYMGGRKKYKRLSVLNFVEVAKFIELNYNCKIILIGSESDKRFSSAFLSRHHSSGIVDLTGKTNLLDVIKIVSDAKAVLSNDSGIAHISAVVGTSTIVPLNGTHLGRFFPYPPAMGLEVQSFYPPEIMNRLNEVDRLADEFKYRSNLNINLISLELIYKKIADWL